MHILEKIRKELNVRQKKEFALKYLKIDPSYYSRILNGENLSDALKRHLTDTYNINPKFLDGESDDVVMLDGNLDFYKTKYYEMVEQNKKLIDLVKQLTDTLIKLHMKIN